MDLKLKRRPILNRDLKYVNQKGERQREWKCRTEIQTERGERVEGEKERDRKVSKSKKYTLAHRVRLSQSGNRRTVTLTQKHQAEPRGCLQA